MEDFNKRKYAEWMRKQTEGGKDQNSNFNTFKQNRHKIKNDRERRAEREAKYGKYEAGPESGFNSKNRAF